jgi:hypothetical protein
MRPAERAQFGHANEEQADPGRDARCIETFPCLVRSRFSVPAPAPRHLVVALDSNGLDRERDLCFSPIADMFLNCRSHCLGLGPGWGMDRGSADCWWSSPARRRAACPIRHANVKGHANASSAWGANYTFFASTKGRVSEYFETNVCRS